MQIKNIASLLILSFGLTACLPVILVSQPIYQAIEKENFTIRARLWTKGHGMPHWHVGGAFQDSRGYYWMQNQAFLTRFDGKSFVIFDTLGISPVFLPKAFFGEDIHGNIWYYLSADSLPKIRIINPFTRKIQSFESYTGTTESPHEIQHLFSIGKIVYAVSTNLHKMWKYDGRWSLVMENPNPKTIERCGFYLPGPDGTFWFGDGQNQLLLLDKNGKTHKEFPEISQKEKRISYSQNQINTYNIDPAGADFLQSRSLSLDVAQGYAPRGADIPWFFPGWGHSEFLPDLKSVLYFGESIGAPLLYDLQSKLSFDLLHEASEALGMALPANLIYPAFKCDFITVNPKLNLSGELLIPINGKGLLQIKIVPKRFHTLAKNTSIRTLTWLNRETMLAIAAMETPRLFEINTLRRETKILPWRYGPYSGVARRANLWLSNRNMNLERLNLQYQLQDSYPQPIINNTKLTLEIRCVTPVSDSIVWYATQLGVVALNLNSRKSNFILRDIEGCWIHQDRNGAYWAATARGLFNFANGKTYLPAINGKDLRVEHIYESPEGTFWLATFHGLVKWEPFRDSFEVISTHDGFISDQLHAVYPDQSGRLWMSSNGGIISFDPSDRGVVNFTTADGLADNEHNYLAHTRGADGQLYFGGVNGITAFHPDDFPRLKDLSLNKIHIDKIQQLNRDGQYLPPLFPGQLTDSILKFERSCIQAVFEFSMADFSNEELIFEWRLQGLFPQWSQFNLEDGITLSGIPHGESLLEIRVKHSGNLNRADTYHFRIFKAYYFYQKNWFRILALLASALLLHLYLRRRTAALEANNRALEQKIAERTATILAQNQKLEQLDEAKTQLFNNISHEFRTPLSIIRGNTEKLQLEARLHKLSVSSLQQIEKQTELLTRMIEEVMDLSKLQMGAISSDPEPVAWNAFLERTFAMLDGLAERKRQVYQLEILPATESFWYVDLKKVERILNNLIGNAIKFTPESGRITVKSEVKEGLILISVSDNGPGIPPEEHALIFDRYRQGSTARGIAQPGYGIGLALCKEYADLMGAKIRVESEPGKGSIFYVELPVMSAPNMVGIPNHNEVTQSMVIPPGKEKSFPGHILVAEDHPELLQFLREILEKEYRISTATNGQEAWSILEADPSINLVLSDVMMPIMDGYTLLQKTRTHPRLGFLPFIMVTALNSEYDRLQALRLGVDGFISKPFSIKELQTHIANRMAQQMKRIDFTAEALPGDIKNPDSVLQIPGSGNAHESYDEAWIANLERLIKENLHRPEYKIPELAVQMHLTERTLYNRIKAYTGLTPSEFLRKARLDQARRFIIARKYRTIKELSIAVGMSDSRNFVIAFTKEFGRAELDNFLNER